jgi:short-subunit dehydrogenase
MGADKGIPLMANDAGAKAYVQSFALSLHDEFKPLGVHVTGAAAGADGDAGAGQVRSRTGGHADEADAC